MHCIGTCNLLAITPRNIILSATTVNDLKQPFDKEMCGNKIIEKLELESGLNVQIWCLINSWIHFKCFASRVWKILSLQYFEFKIVKFIHINNILSYNNRHTVLISKIGTHLYIPKYMYLCQFHWTIFEVMVLPESLHYYALSNISNSLWALCILHCSPPSLSFPLFLFCHTFYFDLQFLLIQSYLTF